MTDANEWLQLATTWQAQTIDLPSLRRSTRWHTLRLYGLLAIELLTVVGIWAMAIYWQWIQPLPTLWQVWAWLWAVLAPALTYMNIRARAGSWQVREDSVRGLLELKQARAQASLRMIRFGNRCLPYAIALAWFWNGLALWLYPPKVFSLWSFSGALLVTLLLGAWAWLCTRRARGDRRTIAETEKLLQDLD